MLQPNQLSKIIKLSCQMKFTTKIIILISFFESIFSVFTPTPFITGKPPLIETGYVQAYSNMTSSTALPNWEQVYTVTLTRLKATSGSDYSLALGIKGWNIDISNDFNQAIQLHSYIPAQRATSFQVKIFFQDSTRFRNLKITYLAVSIQFTEIIIRAEVQNVLSSIVPGAPYVSTPKNYGLIPGTAYIYRFSIYSLKMAYQTTTSTNASLYIQMSQLATGQLNISIRSVLGCYIDNISYFVIVFEPTIFDIWSLENIITYGGSGITIAGQLIVEQAAGIHYPKYPYNFFICLRGFNSQNLVSTFQYYIESDKLKVHKRVNLLELHSTPLLFYANYCNPPFKYEQSSQTCIKCFPYCMECDTSTICTKCYTNFTLSPTNDACTCQYDIVTNICYDFDNSPMKGCSSAAIGADENQINCLMCSQMKNYSVFQNQCICRNGFLLDPSTFTCQQICGDGVAYKSQCDDGNKRDGDGCSSQCKVESTFVCNNIIKPSFCVTDALIGLKIHQVMRNQQNQAVIRLEPTRLPIHADLQFSQFTSDSFQIILTKSLSPPTYIRLYPKLISIENNIIQLCLDYEFTIQDHDVQITVNMSGSKYPKSQPVLRNKLNGKNKPLIYSSLSQVFKKTAVAFIAVTGFILLLLFAGIIAGKFIGLEGIATLQLIFYSQLLIQSNTKWPTAFQIFQSLKYVNGINSIFSLTKYELKNEIQKKFYHLEIKKLFIQNFNINFALLILVFLFFIVTNYFRYSRQQDLLLTQQQNKGQKLQKNKQQKDQENKDKKSNLKQTIEKQGKIKYWLAINEKGYNAIMQISFWCILQLIAGVSASIIIPNNSVLILTSKSEFSLFQHLNLYVLMFTFWLVYLLGFNLFGNLLMSELTLGKMRQRMMELNYKRWYFVYLNVMGWMIVGFNQVNIKNIVPISMFVLLAHVCYMVVLYKLDPYQMSLRVHTIGLWLCQIVYLIFLLFINLINFTQNISQILVLCLAYLILIFCVTTFIFTIIRLYYEYRYGEQLEKQIQKERQLQKKLQIEKQEFLLKKKMIKLQQQANKLISQQQKQRKKNTYLYQNQLSHQNKNQLIQWLNNQPNWTKQMRQEYYYKKFKSKPLNWIKQHDPQNYQLIDQQEQIKRNNQKQKQAHQKNDPSYKNIVQKLKKNFDQKYHQRLYSNT